MKASLLRSSSMSKMLDRIGTRCCPVCGSNMVRTSAISPYLDPFSVRLWLKLSLQRPFRCLDCDERFYALRFKRRAEKSAAA